METNEEIMRRIHQLFGDKKLDILDTFSVVEMPTNVDTMLQDIIQTDISIRELVLQVIGGLDPRRIVLITKDRKHAKDVAHILMKGIDEADHEMGKHVTKSIMDAASKTKKVING